MSTETVEDRFRAVGTTLKGEFRIERVVAEGGFGLVYKATHVGLDRPVAVKVLKTPAEYNEAARHAFVERFKQEARTLLKVNHPAVVQVLDFGASAFPNGEEAAWTAMEWVEGVTLEDELRARRKQGGRHPADALVLLRPVLEAVAVAHDEGIAHRDLKPANIMIVRGKRALAVRLLDFGIAKTMEPGEEAGSGRTRTASQMVACSPRYAAPEQLSSARTGPWSDVHALGMILTEVLTDRLGYGAKDATGLFAEALSPTRPTPAKRQVDVGAWEPVLAKATAIRPDDRYPNAGELLAALVAALPGATHPKAPVGEAALSATGPVPAPGGRNVTSPEALAATAASTPDLRPAVTEDEGDEDPAPQAAPAAGAWAPAPAPAPASPFLAGTQPLPAPGGTLPMGSAAPASSMAVSPTGNTTLRGVTTDTPTPVAAPAPAPRRSPLPVIAAVVAVVAVVASLGFAMTRGHDAPPAAPRATAPAPTAAPTPTAALAAPPPAAAPAAPAPTAPTAPAVAAPAADAAVAAAPAEDDARGRRRSRRSRRARRDSQDYDVE